MKSKLKSLGIKKQERLLDTLRDVIRSAQMKDANFGKHTELVKDETRLYRESWLIAPLERVIRIVEENSRDGGRND
jgi:hypothetical protein